MSDEFAFMRALKPGDKFWCLWGGGYWHLTVKGYWKHGLEVTTGVGKISTQFRYADGKNGMGHMAVPDDTPGVACWVNAGLRQEAWSRVYKLLESAPLDLLLAVEAVVAEHNGGSHEAK